MLLKYPSAQFQSINQLKKFASHQSLSKIIDPSLNNSKIISTQFTKTKSSHKQFIPFYQERDLGKLLSKKSSFAEKQQSNTSVQKLLEIVTFKNFRKLYRMQKKSQQAKYASKIRLSGQTNLINQSEWVLNDIKQKNIRQSRYQPKNSRKSSHFKEVQNQFKRSHQNSDHKLRLCCKSTQLPSQLNLGMQKRSMSKIDLQLYKKLASNRPPSSKDPQLNTLYEHYVQSCELNQNERRRVLTQRK